MLDKASAGASGTVTVEDQILYIKTETLRGKNPTEIHSALCEVCGEETVDSGTVSRWDTRFCEGRVTIIDDPRPGRPKTSTYERSMKLMVDFLAQDRRATCKEVSPQATGISPTPVFRILTKKIAKKRNLCQLVPHCLTAEKKQKRLENAKLLKQIFNAEDQPFLFRIVAIDETWVRDFELELKSHSNEWRSPTSPCPKKFRRAQSKVKQMMIFAYDHRGIIMTENSMWNKCDSSVLS